MPVMDALAATRVIKERWPDVRGEDLVALGKALQAQDMPSPAHFQDPALRGNR